MRRTSIRLTRTFTLSAAALAFAATLPRAQQPDTTRDSTQHAPRDSAHASHTLPVIRVVAAPTQRADAASSVIILPGAIRTVPATDAWDIVRQTAGVEVHLQGQGPGFASDAAVRGFTSDHSVDDGGVIDGVPLNETVSGHAEGYADWNALIPEAVRRVEVTKGPATPWCREFRHGRRDERHHPAHLPGHGVERPRGIIGRFSRAGAHRKRGARRRLARRRRPAARRWLARQQPGSDRPHPGEQAVGRPGARTYSLAVSGYGGCGTLRDSSPTRSIRQATSSRPANPTDGGNEGFGTVRGSLSIPAWSGTLTSSLYAHGGTWHIYLTIPPEGGIGEGVQSQTEELDQRFGMGGTTRYQQQIGSHPSRGGLDYRVVEAQYQRYYTTDRVRDSIFLFDETPANLSALYGGVAPIVEAHWDVTRDLSFGTRRAARLDHYSSEQRERRASGASVAWVATPKLSAIYRFTNALTRVRCVQRRLPLSWTAQL